MVIFPTRFFPFVLVSGGWCGGWCWQPVTQRLEAAGKHVFCVTFTGSGDRAHLLSPHIDLETYILDIINVIRYNDLENVILAAHSLGGLPTVAVLDRLGPRIRHVVYVDGMLPHSGECASDLIAPEVNEERLLQAKNNDGFSIPVPHGVHFPEERVRQWFINHMTPQPLLPYQGRLNLVHPFGNNVRTTYLACTPTHMHPMEISHERARQMPDWDYREIHCGHNAMLLRPELVANVLLETAEFEEKAAVAPS